MESTGRDHGHRIEKNQAGSHHSSLGAVHCLYAGGLWGGKNALSLPPPHLAESLSLSWGCHEVGNAEDLGTPEAFSLKTILSLLLLGPGSFLLCR